MNDHKTSLAELVDRVHTLERERDRLARALKAERERSVVHERRAETFEDLRRSLWRVVANGKPPA